MPTLKILWCRLFHLGTEKDAVEFYSNRTCRYYCSKCNHEYDD